MQVIPIWVRALACLLLVAGIFFSGWNVRGHRADADIAALKLDHEQAARVADDAARAKVAEAEAAGHQIAAGLADELTRLRGASSVVRKEISREKTTAVASGSVHYMPLDWVRLYDAALGSPLDSAGAGRLALGSPGGAGLSDAKPSTVSEWDALENHADNAERWARCRHQLNALIDFVSASVVTRESEQ